MNRKRVYKRCLVIVLMIMIASAFFMTKRLIDNTLPGKITLKSNEQTEMEFDIPVSLAGKQSTTQTAMASSIKFNAGEKGRYSFIYKVFGIIPVKEVNVNVTDNDVITPAGIPIGLYLHTDGVMVIGNGEITDKFGNISSPSKGLVETNDYIVYFNGKKVNSKSQLIYLISENKNNPVNLKINRNGNMVSTQIIPVLDENGEYKIGVWVRDDTQGIGTLTFITSEGKFGALGHGVSDVDTSELLDSTNGKLYKANIWGIKKGEDGTPGGLCGTITYTDENILGNVNNNTHAGLYGTMTSQSFLKDYSLKAMEIGYKQEVKKGKAYIQFLLNEKPELYEIRIRKIDISDGCKEKNLIIEVTDQRLIKRTNGIVQGMSGSPIIQNGKVIGAVTHVFVNDSKKGYGIFIENMLEECN